MCPFDEVIITLFPLWPSTNVATTEPLQCLVNRLIKLTKKDDMKLPRTLLSIYSGIHRWIPLTKGQQCGKCFHGMMASLMFQHECCHSGTIHTLPTAPSHYLNQCWLIITEVLWHLSESSFMGKAQYIYP